MAVALSIGIPVHNAAGEIERCARSLFGQTIANEVEFIFIDDGSTDGGLDIVRGLLRAYPEKVKSVRILTFGECRGVSAARQAFLESAKGEYIGFCDADDWTEPSMFDDLLKAAREKDADVVWEDYYADVKSSVRRISQKGASSDVELIRGILTGTIGGFLCNKLISRRLIDRSGVSFHRGVTCEEDLLFLCEALSAGGVVAYCRNAHYHYVQRRDSATNGGWSRHLDSLLFVSSVLERQLPEEYESALRWWRERVRYDVMMDAGVRDDDLARVFPEIRKLTSPFFSIPRRLAFAFARRGGRPMVLTAKRLVGRSRKALR